MRWAASIALGVLLMAGAFEACAFEGSGGISLEAQPSANAIAMGETGLLELQDPLAFAANPATLTSVPAAGVKLGRSGLVEGVTASVVSFSAAIPLGSGVMVPDVGEVSRRFGAGFRLDHSGIELSQGTDWGWDLLAIGAAYRLTPYASAGLAAKYLFSNSDLEGTDVRAFAVDLGALLEMTPSLRLAASLRNVLGTARWEDGEDESPPLAVGLGAGFTLPFESLAHLAYTFSSGAPGKLGLGIDIPVAATGFSLRAGYLRHSGEYARSVFTSGFGYTYGGFEIDYAVRLDDEIVLGTTHHFSIGYVFR